MVLLRADCNGSVGLSPWRVVDNGSSVRDAGDGFWVLRVAVDAVVAVTKMKKFEVHEDEDEKECEEFCSSGVVSTFVLFCSCCCRLAL